MVDVNVPSGRKFEALVTVIISGFILATGLAFYLGSATPCPSPPGDLVCGPSAGGVAILSLVVGAVLLTAGVAWMVIVPRIRGSDAENRD